MKYGFKYNSNSSFKVIVATDSAGYTITELKEVLKEHYTTELKQLESMTDSEFIKYYGVN